MLKPLEEWICDSCGEVINSPEQGYVEWKETKGKMHDFRIVHHVLHSPRSRNGSDCYDRECAGNSALDGLVRVFGLVVLTSWIDAGKWHQEEYSGPFVDNLREWTTFFRRLQVPYFEEARHCIAELCDAREGAANEVFLYLPDTLKEIIERHESAS